MAGELTSKQENDIEELFALFDVSGSGTISTHDLESAMWCMGKRPTEADRREVVNGDGTITLSKFMDMMKRKLAEELFIEEYDEAFQVFDGEGYGILSADDLRNAMTNQVENLTVEEADKILKEAGIKKGDGEVDYKELVMVATSQ